MPRSRALSVIRAGEPLCRVPTADSLVPFCTVKAGESLSLCLTGEEEVRRELRLEREALEGPLPAGTAVGEAVYFLGDQEVGRVPLVTGQPVRLDRSSGGDLLGRILTARLRMCAP